MVSQVGASQHEELTQQERDAGFDVEQLKQLVGLVEYDEAKDVFPGHRLGRHRLRRRQRDPDRALLPGRLGYAPRRLPRSETGYRDHKSYVLESGSIRFVICGAVDPDSLHADHHRRHGDGVASTSRSRCPT